MSNEPNPTGESTDPDSHRILAEREIHRLNLEAARKAADDASAEVARLEAEA